MSEYRTHLITFKLTLLRFRWERYKKLSYKSYQDTKANKKEWIERQRQTCFQGVTAWFKFVLLKRKVCCFKIERFKGRFYAKKLRMA